jgi:hypothetical protein
LRLSIFIYGNLRSSILCWQVEAISTTAIPASNSFFETLSIIYVFVCANSSLLLLNNRIIVKGLVEVSNHQYSLAHMFEVSRDRRFKWHRGEVGSWGLG